MTEILDFQERWNAKIGQFDSWYLVEFADNILSSAQLALAKKKKRWVSRHKRHGDGKHKVKWKPQWLKPDDISPDLM